MARTLSAGESDYHVCRWWFALWQGHCLLVSQITMSADGGLQVTLTAVVT